MPDAPFRLGVPRLGDVLESRDDAPLFVDRMRAIGGRTLGEAIVDAARRIPSGPRIVIRSETSIDCLCEILAVWLGGGLAVVVDGREPAATLAAVARSAGVGSESERCPGAAIVALRTSGSSGEPKLAAHGWSSLWANAKASNARIAFSAGDRWLLSLSPHHIGGLGIVLRALAGGGTVRVGRGPSAIAADLMDDGTVTHVSVVASQLRRLLDDPALDERLRRLDAILLGGGPTPNSWRDEAIRRGWPLHTTYGLTECASQVSTGPAVSGLDAADAGRPLDGVEVSFAADGEILVGGPTVFLGYFERGALRDARGADGLFATGDLGHVDEHGRLAVTGRKDAMFISGGENIRPEEIEATLRSVPGIVQACVVAIDDERWQKRPVAFIAGSFQPVELEETLARSLPRFKWPDRIHAMPAEEAERAKPRRHALSLALEDAPELWRRPIPRSDG